MKKGVRVTDTHSLEVHLAFRNVTNRRRAFPSSKALLSWYSSAVGCRCQAQATTGAGVTTFGDTTTGAGCGFEPVVVV